MKLGGFIATIIFIYGSFLALRCFVCNCGISLYLMFSICISQSYFQYILMFVHVLQPLLYPIPF